ncbi:hypothetical protein Q6D67_13200 [Haliea sp. E1-2-M8]|uniref:flavin-dependent monooxygenase QhpG n=1 Tax=Haliea sp. E1-2-M8 TaxID=3064706 RepID=UPI00272209CE|nr:hypothetical protein [Haliea sp. E1-2-M8]MDO8862661.1 hypothetical protein [Haliea sp. E1-2-M8]
MSRPSDIVVAGGGPAGCCAALGLQQMGYRVLLLATPRPWPSCEGFSARALQGLQQAGLNSAAACLGAASPRRATWNGTTNDANSEHLVLREALDQALLADVRSAGIEVITGQLGPTHALENGGSQLQVRLASGGSVARGCRFLIDARGRAAGGGGNRLRGPESVSLVQVRQGPPEPASSYLYSLPSGWAWLAQTGAGLLFLQLTVSAEAGSLPARSELDSWFNALIQPHHDITDRIVGTSPTGPVFARGSTSVLRNELVSGALLRVGDAAMAVDPLSGNGVFQALSSALAAPAVVNSLLQHPDDRSVAEAFYRQRVEHLFLRFARTGRDFYRLEQRWPQESFWRQRRNWPDDEPSHSDISPRFLGLQTGAVLDGDRIRAAPVAVTSDQPLGVWHVAGITLAPLLEGLPDTMDARHQLLLDRIKHTISQPQKAQLVQAWLQRYGLL